MMRWIANTLGIVLISVAAIIGWAAWQIGSMASENRAEVKTGLHSVFAESRDITIALLDKGRPGKPETMGLIPAVKFMAQDADSVIKQSGTQVEQTGALITVTAQNMNTVGDSVKQVAGRLSGTADAATGTLQAATETLDEGKRTIAAAQPLLVAYTRSGNDLDALLKDDALRQTIANVSGITDNMNGVTLDFKNVADKATTDYLTPVPWWKRPIQKFGVTWDILGAVARHTP